MKAYVAFVQAYSKHGASYIFRLQDLDLIGVAKSFGLFRLPAMPELKKRSRDGWDDADVDVRLAMVSSFKPDLIDFLVELLRLRGQNSRSTKACGGSGYWQTGSTKKSERKGDS